MEFFKNLERLSSDYRPSVDRPSTKCWPITDRYISQASTNYRRSVGEVSVNEKLYRPRHIWNDYRPCLDRVSTDYRPTIDRYLDRASTECRPSIDRVSTEYRLSVDQVSTDCRPTVDWLSTECRPLYRLLYRPISRSTLPIVNKIQFSLVSLNLNFFFAHSVLPQIALLAVGSVISSAY